MTSSNRHDLLTEALLYHSRKKIEKLPALLCTRFEKAQKLATESEENLKELLKTLPTPVPVEVVATWVEEQRMEATLTNETLMEDSSSWQKEYIKKILSNRQLRQNLMLDGETEETVTQNVALLRSSEKELKEFERCHKVKSRWNLGSDGVKNLVLDVTLDEKSELIKNLRMLAFERTFLIGIKRKYADGQKLAKALSKSINQKVAAIEKLVKQFNHKIMYLRQCIPGIQKEIISSRDAFDLESDIYCGLDANIADASIPVCLKVRAVNLYVTWKRALEELILLGQDAQNTIDFILMEREKIKNAITALQVTHEKKSNYNIGARSLLFEELAKMTFSAAKAIALIEQPNYFADLLTIDMNEIKQSASQLRAAFPAAKDIAEEQPSDKESYEEESHTDIEDSNPEQEYNSQQDIELELFEY